MTGMLCFDMDGTLANTYGVENWLDKLLNSDVTPYQEAEPMWDMPTLNEVLMQLEKLGWEVRIVSWLSKGSSPDYAKEVRKAKADWLEKYDFPCQKYHFMQYGTTKANSVREACSGVPCILFDDDDKVRRGWHLGDTVNPADTDIIEYLQNLLDEMEEE